MVRRTYALAVVLSSFPCLSLFVLLNWIGHGDCTIAQSTGTQLDAEEHRRPSATHENVGGAGLRPWRLAWAVKPWI